jgi:hypothetical protein
MIYHVSQIRHYCKSPQAFRSLLVVARSLAYPHSMHSNVTRDVEAVSACYIFRVAEHTGIDYGPK